MAGGGFVILAATLESVPAIPLASLALLVGIDRFMGECRSLTNFIGNGVATIGVRYESLRRKRGKHRFGTCVGTRTYLPTTEPLARSSVRLIGIVSE